eukprot:CAMPEP_0116882794 /NCGR_PEP_ID=MMETSP0463-20121206/15150_1 /TAXON_ID=181622 /ORGANISM="Strombidinopsis sp, Strain SopsisLIS2011" /LENGTH=39 /DNA_ID= /DNA_START= /DNA_END= /DNA_ORIENTATION=
MSEEEYNSMVMNKNDPERMRLQNLKLLLSLRPGIFDAED